MNATGDSGARRLAAMLRLELKRTLFSRRRWWMYLMFAAPALLDLRRTRCTAWRAGSGVAPSGRTGWCIAAIFQFFYLRLAIFFGCLGIFSNLFRGEVLEKTLHYYLLAPVRREVLLAGKYAGGPARGGDAVRYAAPRWPSSVSSCISGRASGTTSGTGRGSGNLGWYLAVMALACVGYGAVFLTAGLVFRNPMLPAAVVMVWEAINGYLPEMLQKFSVIFYLKSLCPVEVPFRGPLALIAVVPEPVPAWLAIPGLLVVSLLVLIYAASKVRKIEVSYSE